MDYLKDLKNWKPYEFKPPSKENGRLCYIKNQLCFDKKLRRIEIVPKWYVILISIIIVMVITYVIMYIEEVYFDYPPAGFYRFFSISFISGLMLFLALVYNIQFIRAIVIGLIPLIFTYPFILLIFNAYYGYGLSTLDILKSFSNHILHFILIIFILRQKQETPHQSMIISAIFWFSMITLTYLIYPNYAMFYYLSYFPTMCITIVSIFIAWITLFIRQKKKLKKNNIIFFK